MTHFLCLVNYTKLEQYIQYLYVALNIYSVSQHYLCFVNQNRLTFSKQPKQVDQWTDYELNIDLRIFSPTSAPLTPSVQIYGERSQLSLHFTHSLSLLRSGTLGWLLPHLQTNIFSCGNVNSASTVFFVRSNASVSLNNFWLWFL